MQIPSYIVASAPFILELDVGSRGALGNSILRYELNWTRDNRVTGTHQRFFFLRCALEVRSDKNKGNDPTHYAFCLFALLHFWFLHFTTSLPTNHTRIHPSISVYLHRPLLVAWQSLFQRSSPLHTLSCAYLVLCLPLPFAQIDLTHHEWIPLITPRPAGLSTASGR